MHATVHRYEQYVNLRIHLHSELATLFLSNIEIVSF